MVVGNSKVTSKSRDLKTTKIVKESNVTSTSSMENKEKTIEEENKPNPREDGALIGRTSWSQTP